MRLPRTLAVSLTAAACLAATLAPATAVPPPADPVKIALGSLSQGAGPAVPTIFDEHLLDGDVDVALPSLRPMLLGTSGQDYIVLTFTNLGTKDIRRVTPTGVSTVLTTGKRLWDATLSDDGSYVVISDGRRKKSTFTTLDTTSGAQIATKTFAKRWASVVDADATRVLASSDADGTWLWEPVSGTVTTVSKKMAYRADLANDRMAYFDHDPYLNGCSVLTRVSKPTTKIWRSCSERIEVFGPQAKRLITVDILSDGIGPSAVGVRRGGGRPIAVYTVKGYFGTLAFEDRDHVLLEAVGRKKTAIVRCDATATATCERATKRRPAPLMRTLAPRGAVPFWR